MLCFHSGPQQSLSRGSHHTHIIHFPRWKAANLFALHPTKMFHVCNGLHNWFPSPLPSPQQQICSRGLRGHPGEGGEVPLQKHKQEKLVGCNLLHFQRFVFMQQTLIYCSHLLSRPMQPFPIAMNACEIPSGGFIRKLFLNLCSLASLSSWK